MDLGTLLLIAGLAYGLGVLWYSLLPARMPDKVWRVAAYPFVGIFVAEALLTPALNFDTFDPKFGGINLISATIGSLVAVAIDWAISEVRKPSLEAAPHASATTVR